jgi:isopenicillin-N N-acyltransferase-like protein
MRRLFEQTSAEGCIRAAEEAPRGMSQNMLVATPRGSLDLELTVDSVGVLKPQTDGLLIHTNHFLDSTLASRDELVGELPDTLNRYRRIRGLIAALGRKPSVEDMKTILSDHDGKPVSVCRHRTDDPVYGYLGTVCSIIMEPDEGRMHLSRGNPCTNPYETYTL